MGKQSKDPKPENLGKGKVTPVQVAFMVDRYLSDNNYTKTLSVFRIEASNLISKAKFGGAPKGLLSLGTILDEYICLKEQKLMLDQEKSKVEKLLQGMQDVMNAYSLAGTILPVAPTAAMIPSPQMDPRNGSVQGYPLHNTPAADSVCILPSNTPVGNNASNPIASLPPKNKRKASGPVSNAIRTVKKSCSQIPVNSTATGGDKIPLETTNTYSSHKTGCDLSIIQSQSSSPDNPHRGYSDQGSSVARRLFEQPSKPQTLSPSPKTPPQVLLPSQADNSVSPSESSFVRNSSSCDTTQQLASTNCHVFSSKTVIVSPYKHIRISSSPLKSTPKGSNRRDHIKGRLDFSDSDVPNCPEGPVAGEISPSTTAGEMVNIFADIPNFDFFGEDFSLSELLVDIDIESNGMTLPLHQSFDPSVYTSPDNELENGVLVPDGSSSEPPPMSSLTAVVSERDISRQGSESLISVKSVTKCYKIVSPVKNRLRSSSEQVDLQVRE